MTDDGLGDLLGVSSLSRLYELYAFVEMVELAKSYVWLLYLLIQAFLTKKTKPRIFFGIAIDDDTDTNARKMGIGAMNMRGQTFRYARRKPLFGGRVQFFVIDGT